MTKTVRQEQARPDAAPAPRSHASPTPPPISRGTRQCTDPTYVTRTYVGADTSCPFAASVYRDYDEALVKNLERTGDRRPVPRRVAAFSPVTNRSYQMVCAPNAMYVSCTGGIDSLVRFRAPDPCGFDHNVYSYCATRANPYCQQGQCFYPAPASRACASGWTYQAPTTRSGPQRFGSCGQQSQEAAGPPTSSSQSISAPTMEEPGSTSHAGDVQFCSTGNHICIPNFSAGAGYVVQCRDGEWSHSGGESGACSEHGGEG